MAINVEKDESNTLIYETETEFSNFHRTLYKKIYNENYYLSVLRYT